MIKRPPIKRAESLYMTDLGARLIRFVDEKRARIPRRFRGQNYWSLRQLSRDIDMPLVTMLDYLNRKTPMSLLAMDRIMAGLKISVIDLLHPREIATRYYDIPKQERLLVRQIAVQPVDSVADTISVDSVAE